MTDILGSVLVLSMLALMAARSVSPIAARMSGKPVLQVPLRPVFRLLDQRTNIGAILVVLILGSGVLGERWISHGLFLFAVIVMVGILFIPTSYRFTTDGVSPTRATFRSWDEFDGWNVSGNIITLKGMARFSSVRLYLAQQDQEAVLKLFKRYVSAGSKRRPVANPPSRQPRTLVQQKGGTR